jgi:hypothetical protein
MKDICVVDKLEEFEDSIIIQPQCEYYVLKNNKWERIERFNGFKYINTKYNTYIKFDIIMKNFDNMFDKIGDNFKIRICISDDQCPQKIIKRKKMKIFREIKEIDFEIIKVIKSCFDSEPLLIQRVVGEINNIDDIDNYTL